MENYSQHMAYKALKRLNSTKFDSANVTVISQLEWMIRNYEKSQFNQKTTDEIDGVILIFYEVDTIEEKRLDKDLKIL